MLRVATPAASLPPFNVVGLPDNAVKESRERITALLITGQVRACTSLDAAEHRFLSVDSVP
jgi:hypothetical protein